MTSTGLNGKLRFFPYLIAYMVILYIVLTVLAFVLFDRKRYIDKDKKKKSALDDCCQRCGSFFVDICCCICCCCGIFKLCNLSRPLLFLDTLYCSHLGMFGVLLLWFFRTVSFLFFAYYSIYVPMSSDWTTSYQFSFWANVIVTTYFLLSSIISSNGAKARVLYPPDGDERPYWSITMEWIGVLTLILYEVAMCNAVFVTVVSYTYFSQDMSFENMRIHLLPAIAIFFEQILNTMPFRLEHYGFAMTLPMAYLVFQWVTVALDYIPWQYSLLYTSHVKCFKIYSILVCTHVVLYYLCSGFHHLRDWMFKVDYEDRHRTPEDEFIETIAEFPDEESVVHVEQPVQYMDDDDSDEDGKHEHHDEDEQNFERHQIRVSQAAEMEV